MRQKFPEAERKNIVIQAKKVLWSKEGESTLNYFKEKRKLDEETIKQFEFGYAPERINHELSGRIIMPLFDPYDSLVAITSRDVRENSFQPHWHESFDKSLYLYGLNLAKNCIIQNKKVIVVEGQFDVAYLHKIGYKMSVAIMGSAISFAQIILLSRYCSEMFFFFDGDEGGEKVGQKVINIYNEKKLWKSGINFFLVDTPRNKDPDDFTKEEVFELLKKSREKRPRTKNV